MDTPTAPPSFLADRQRVASIRSSLAPPGPGTASPAFSLADVVRIGGESPTPLALDAPKVQTRRRLYLPACFGKLGWDQGTELRLHVDRGHGVLMAGPGRGAVVRRSRTRQPTAVVQPAIFVVAMPPR